MTGPFETVSEIKEWLDTEPTYEEAKEALAVEKANAARTTGKGAIKEYLDSLSDPGGGSETVEFRVQRAYGDHEAGDTVELDPDEEETTSLRRGRQITLL